MDTVLGLGSAGCAIAEAFSRYPQYKILKVDSRFEQDSDHCYELEAGLTHKEYEAAVPDMSEFFSQVEGDSVLFIVGGGGYISGASLKLLEQLHLLKKKLHVMYVKPEVELLSGDKLLQENLTYRVLQEFARSGVFERLYLVHNPTVEKLIGEVSLSEYHKMLNSAIVSTFHMLNVFSHTAAEYESVPSASDTARISTIGVMNLEKNEESFFFPLDNVTDRCYYYAINEKVLEEDVKLFGTIKEQVRDRTTQESRTGYKIYSTKYEDNLGYCVAHSNQIQIFPEKNEETA